MNIICLGETVIDFKATEHLAFKAYVGGSPLNVAVAAARLGASVGFASQVSTDLFGHHVMSHLKTNHIDPQFVERSDAPSTLAFVDEIAGDAHYQFLSNGAADTLYDPQPRPSFPTDVRFIEFGSISLLTEPSSSAIIDIVRQHKERCITVFDPNIRPALIQSRGDYLQKLQDWLALSQLVKVSTQDLRWLYPDTPHSESARKWLELGPEVVLVTDGSNGVTLLDKAGQELSIPAPQVDIVDTVGAGDTFTGAMMTKLLEHVSGATLELSLDNWQNVLRWANAAATLNCTKAGAQPPSREELERFCAHLP